MQTLPVGLIITSIPFLASMGFTPGPNNILLASSGVNFGFRASIPHMLGITIGYPTMLLLVGLGLARLFMALPWVHGVLKYLCVAYLLYLAWRIARMAAVSDAPGPSRPFTFLQAAAFQWINGKGWVVALSAVTTYTVVDRSLPLQVLILAGISLVITVACVTSWTLFGAFMRRFLHTPARRRGFNYGMAGLLVISVLPVLWE